MYRTDVKDAEKKKSPIKYYLTFSGETGKYRYWDGVENQELDSLEFVLVKTMSSVTGWSDSNNARIYSNLVNSTKKEELVVRAGKEELVRGLYSDVKSDIEAAGGSYTANLFALGKIGEKWVPINLQLKGAALAAWSNFVEKEGIFNILGKDLVAAGCGDQKTKGKVKYFEPAFAVGALSDDVRDMADVFTDTELKPYFEK